MDADELRRRHCDGKVPRTATQARRLAAHFHADGDLRMCAYRCVFCHAWHVGHIPSMRAVREMARLIRER